MRRGIQALAFPLVLGTVLICSAPQLADGQTRGGDIYTENVSLNFLTENVSLILEAKPGVELKPGADLGTFLMERTRVSSSEDGRPVNLGLWVEAFSQREGSLGRFDTSPLKLEPGRTHPGKAWIKDPGQVGELTAPMFGDRRKEGLIVKLIVVINHEEQYSAAATLESKQGIVFPDVCKDAPYALLIGVSMPEMKGNPSVPKCVVCLAD